jgi:small subunit ribosomal protein S17
MPRRVLEGNVVGDQNDKTITVLVERRFRHPVYKKYIKSTSKYRAHDEQNQFKIGDRVSIIECRPISKNKKWTVVTGDEAAAPAPKKEVAPKAAPKKEVATADKKPAAKKPAAKKSEKKDK